jgi:ATP-binding cassette subfamily B protein RaxB
MSRFDSTQPITELISHGLIQAILDGLMATITLAVMAYYSPILTSFAFTALVICIAIRLAWFNTLRAASAGTITARAIESSTLIETIRGISAIKLFAREGERQRFWQNKKADVINATIKSSKIQVVFDGLTNLVLALENVAFIYFAIKDTISGIFTIGMIFAFQAYKNQFLGASTRLVGQWVQFKLLDVHLSRISDIALNQVEALGLTVGSEQRKNLSGRIEVRGLRFSYGLGEREVLKGVNLSIKAGEVVALVGPSGGGKTTLLKLMLGLQKPNYGDVMVDGQSLSNYGLSEYRRQIGTVLQEDSLYSGSIAENIAFFVSDINMDHVRQVAILACIHDEISAMPMSYETLVGNMGSTLSGGQRQRILLARALYPQPRILFMDEGTANLDPLREREIQNNIRSLGITSILITHSVKILETSDKVILLDNGLIREVTMSKNEKKNEPAS